MQGMERDPSFSMLPGNLPCKVAKLRCAQPSSIVKQEVLGAIGELQMVRIFQELAKRTGTRPLESKCPIWKGEHLSKCHSAMGRTDPEPGERRPQFRGWAQLSGVRSGSSFNPWAPVSAAVTMFKRSPAFTDLWFGESCDICLLA